MSLRVAAHIIREFGPGERHGNSMARFRTVLVFVLQSATIGLAAAFVVVYLFPGLVPGRGQPPANGHLSYASAVQAAAPAVVNLVSAASSRAPGNGGISTVESLGSGVIMDAEGYVITNDHVIDGVENVQVFLTDGRAATAVIVGSDPDTDLALLKIVLEGLPTIPLGRSDTLQVGDIVLAIGNPFSIGQTVTQGIVSGTRRGQLGLSPFENFIQTDAAINLGNSGGALIDAAGQLVGINTAFFSRRLDSEGIGFAIPVNLVRGVMRDLIDHGRVIRGWLGVGTETLTPDQADALGLDEGFGIILTSVQADSPADRAGLRPADVITYIDDKPVVVWQDALRLIARMEPGARVTLTGNRLGQEFQVVAEVAERPPLDGG